MNSFCELNAFSWMTTFSELNEHFLRTEQFLWIERIFLNWMTTFSEL